MIFNHNFVTAILLNVKQIGDFMKLVFNIQFCEDNLMRQYFPVR